MIQKNWQEYINKNLDLSPGLQVRGYVANDDKENFVKNSIKLANTISFETGLASYNGLRILDMGCANGRLPIGIDALGETPQIYFGLDVMRKPIEFCMSAFAHSSRHHFIHLDVQNDRYAAYQKGKVQGVGLPGDDFDLIVANSLFTHLGHPINAQLYLNLLASGLGENGILFATWFKSPPNRVNFAAKRTVYSEGVIRTMYEKSGLDIVLEFGGDTTKNTNQWHLIAEKRK